MHQNYLFRLLTLIIALGCAANSNAHVDKMATHKDSSPQTKAEKAYNAMLLLLGNLMVTQSEWEMDRSRIVEDARLKTLGQKGCDYQDDAVKTEIVIRSTDDSSHRGKSGMKMIEKMDFARKDNFCTAGANFYIDDEGYVYSCRELNKKPAVSIPNTGVIGINVMGSFNGDARVSAEMQSSLEHLIAALQHGYGPLLVVPLSQRNAQASTSFPKNPGSAILAILDDVRANARSIEANLLDGTDHHACQDHHDHHHDHDDHHDHQH